MKKTLTAVIVILATLIVLFIAFRVGNKLNNYHWNKSLRTDRNNPYDLSVCYASLEETLADNWHETTPTDDFERQLQAMESRGLLPFNYVFIGKHFYLSQTKAELILSQVRKGSVLFISAETLPAELLQLIPETRSLYLHKLEGDTVNVQLQGPDKLEHVFVNQYKNASKVVAWNYFVHPNWSQYFPSSDDMGVEILGKINGKYPDFISLKIGFGTLYLHVNPVYFGNIHLQKESGVKYFKKVCQNLPKQRTLFDKNAAYPFHREQVTTRNSVFAFIKENQALTYAWWIFISGLLVFLILGGRRKQMSIPVISEPGNYALSMVRDIGQFYFEEKKNSKAFKQEWNHFIHFIKRNFRIQMSTDNEHIESQLAEKSGVDLELIKRVFVMYNKYKIFSELSDVELTHTHQLLHEFYTEYFNKNGKQ